MASRAQQPVIPWKHLPASPINPLRPLRTRSASALAPVLLPVKKRRERKLATASTFLALMPGALGERIKWRLAMLDGLGFGAAALMLRQIMHAQQLSFDGFALSVAFESVLTFLFAFADGAYSRHISRPLQKQLLVLGKASVLAWLMMTILARNAPLTVCWYSLLSFFTGVVLRIVRHHHLENASAHRAQRNVLIVGAGPQERELADALHNTEFHPRRVAGFLDDKHGPNVLGGIADLARVARAEFVDEIIVGNIAQNRLPWVMEEAARNRLDITVVPEFFGHLPTPDSFECIGDCALLKLLQVDAPLFGQLWKRALDLVASGFGLIVTAPILGVITILVKLDSPGPVLYQSMRAGRKGREFTCFKFRTMVVNADALKDSLRPRNERSGPCFKIAADPRLTRVGYWLRRYSLDELPQLWNVFRGHMSLVGPRPHPLDDYRQYRLEHLKRLDVTPGLTGLWQVTARSSPSFQHNVALDLAYIERWSIWLDLRILLRTVKVVFSGSGA